MRSQTSPTLPAHPPFRHQWRYAASVGVAPGSTAVRRVAVLLSMLVVLAGCGAGDSASWRDPGMGSASPSAAGLKISGIVVLDTSKESTLADEVWTLRTFDPDSGENVLNLKVPAEAGSYSAPSANNPLPRGPLAAAQARAAFSADWQYAAWPDHDGAMHILRLEPKQRSYLPYRTIMPDEGSYSGGEVKYDMPWFGQHDNRLWFEAVPTKGPTKLVSVDYTAGGSSTEAPREEGVLKDHLRHWWLLPAGALVQTVYVSPNHERYLLDGEPLAEIGNRDDPEYLRYVEADGKVAGGHLVLKAPYHPVYQYEFVATIDDRTMLMRAAEPGEVADKYGEVVTVRVDEQGDSATIEPVADKAADGLRGVALSPDRKWVLLVTDDGGFRKDLGSTGEPEPLRVQVEPAGDAAGPVFVLGWS